MLTRQEAADIAPGGRATCLKHGKACKIPAGPEDLFVQGFDCKRYSRQNPDRFKEDVTLRPHVTLQAAADHLRTRRPRFALLENTAGLQPLGFEVWAGGAGFSILFLFGTVGISLSHFKILFCPPFQLPPRLSCGGGNPEPALNFVLETLRASVPDGAVVPSLSGSRPLPSDRQRILFFCAAVEAEAVKDMQKGQQVLMEKLPPAVHHIKTFLRYKPMEASAGNNDNVERSAVAVASREAQYLAAFSRGLEKAIGGGRLAADVLPPLREARLSNKFLNTTLTPWMLAQLDVYSMILQHDQECHGATPEKHLLADVGQTANRGGHHTDGTAPVITTGSNWFDFTRSSFVHPESYFAVHGHDVSKLDFTGLSERDIHFLAGNGMTTTMLVLALTPILAKLGYLEKLL